ncbi:unnamed protein product [Sphagnum troendelagicum]|uniref:ACB domain-containing protein n=1 Tax=Sphagnum troendelagicum TaxID=128251 RepID=A0ABP0V0A7_9BRYO
MTNVGMAAATLPYPNRFYAGAAYAGFSASSPGNVDSLKSSSLGLSDDTTLLLYGLYKQATVGPCNVPKPWSWNVIDLAKWTSWNQLGRMDSMEAMRLFIRTLEEEDPSWWSKAQEQDKELVVAVELNGEDKVDDEMPVVEAPPASNGLSKLNGVFNTTEVEEVAEGVRAIPVYNEWVLPTVTGRRPSARYQHAAEVVNNKLYVIGGNHNGRYLNDVQFLDLKTLEWSKVEKVPQSPLSEQQKQLSSWFPPCAGHSLIRWGTKLLAVAGHSKEPVDTVTVRAFDTNTMTWTILDVHGKTPIARGGQSVTLVGSTLVMFGGEDSKRRLMNDLNILDLETLTWKAVDTSGTRPSPRSDHVAAAHGDRYLFLFGGGSHSSCYNDLYVLDLDSMEWSQAQTGGTVPSPRAGHAGATIGNSLYIIGGGDNKSGISDTLVLNMDTLVWSVVATVKGRAAVASEGLSVVVVEDSLLAFGGYNGHFNNQVYVFRTFPAEKVQSKILESSAAAAAAVSAATAVAAPSPPAHSSLVNGKSSSSSPDTQETVVEPKEVSETVQDSMAVELPTEESEVTREKLALALKVNEELQAATVAAQAECAKLQNELAAYQFSSSELEQELHSVRQQLAAEQSRSFRLEVDVAELRKKLQSMETLQKELELLQRQKAASDEAAVQAVQKQQSTGVWSWLAGNPLDAKGDED